MGEVRDTERSFYSLRLYVAGQSPKSMAAVSNIREICEDLLGGRYRIEVIDLVKDPQLAQRDRVIAIPTLIRGLPVPLRRVIGDLSDRTRVLVGLEIGEYD